MLVDGNSGMLIRFAGCCNPIEGDDIVGYISRGKGVTIHRHNCQNLRYLEPERLINATWLVKEGATFPAIIKVVANKENNSMAKLTSLITSLKINLRGFDAKEIDNAIVCILRIEIKNKAELDRAINSMKNIKSVTSVQRSEK